MGYDKKKFYKMKKYYMARELILFDALTEIEAAGEFDSDQPIKNIIAGCIKELNKLSKKP